MFHFRKHWTRMFRWGPRALFSRHSYFKRAWEVLTIIPPIRHWSLSKLAQLSDEGWHTYGSWGYPHVEGVLDCRVRFSRTMEDVGIGGMLPSNFKPCEKLFITSWCVLMRMSHGILKLLLFLPWFQQKVRCVLYESMAPISSSFSPLSHFRFSIIIWICWRLTRRIVNWRTSLNSLLLMLLNTWWLNDLFRKYCASHIGSWMT